MMDDDDHVDCSPYITYWTLVVHIPTCYVILHHPSDSSKETLLEDLDLDS